MQDTKLQILEIDTSAKFHAVPHPIVGESIHIRTIRHLGQAIGVVVDIDSIRYHP